jgi:fatty acid desaturase
MVSTKEQEVRTPEQKRETYRAMAITGWLIFLFDALVLFFLPAGLRLGQGFFLPIVILIAVVGLGVAITGHVLKRLADQE